MSFRFGAATISTTVGYDFTNRWALRSETNVAIKAITASVSLLCVRHFMASAQHTFANYCYDCGLQLLTVSFGHASEKLKKIACRFGSCNIAATVRLFN